LTKNGENIFWIYWRDAYEWDQANNALAIHEKLKEDHFNLTPGSRMRNGLAEDVLDRKMLYLMEVYVHLKLEFKVGKVSHVLNYLYMHIYITCIYIVLHSFTSMLLNTIRFC
jgi:hypothetical protein